jgi:hypothetical protein
MRILKLGLVLLSGGLWLAASEVGAQGTDDASRVTGILIEQGIVPHAEGAAFAIRLRTQLHERDVCGAEDQTQCQKRLRQQVRACQEAGLQHGAIRGPREAADVALALMIMSHGTGDPTQAGELIQWQLGHRWQSRSIREAAEMVAQVAGQRWRRETLRMLRDGCEEGGCSYERARQAVVAMHQASRRIDLDARRTRKAIQQVLREQQAHGERTDTEVQAQVRSRIRSGQAEGGQKTHRYRYRIDGEQRRGGQFGGTYSGGRGMGLGKGPPHHRGGR